jgi:hypothetical protein
VCDECVVATVIGLVVVEVKSHEQKQTNQVDPAGKQASCRVECRVATAALQTVDQSRTLLLQSAPRCLPTRSRARRLRSDDRHAKNDRKYSVQSRTHGRYERMRSGHQVTEVRDRSRKHWQNERTRWAHQVTQYTRPDDYSRHELGENTLMARR